MNAEDLTRALAIVRQEEAAERVHLPALVEELS